MRRWLRQRLREKDFGWDESGLNEESLFPNQQYSSESGRDGVRHLASRALWLAAASRSATFRWGERFWLVTPLRLHRWSTLHNSILRRCGTWILLICSSS